MFGLDPAAAAAISGQTACPVPPCLSANLTSEFRFTRVRKILALRGPNVWARDTVLECWVEFPPVTELVPNWRGWLLSWMPTMEPLLREEVLEPDALTLAKVLKHITLRLQSRSDLQLTFYKIV